MVPLVAVIAVAALSLTSRPPALTSTLTSDAFDGGWTMQELQTLAHEFPDRPPGGPADDALARRVAQTLESLDGAFHVSVRHTSGQTVEGERSLLTVLAVRPGKTSESPIVVLAHRDASGSGSEAALSGTAVLLELARVLADRETNRTVLLVSTSGGSGGDTGAASFASALQGGRIPWLARSGLTAAQTGASGLSGPQAGTGAAGASPAQTESSTGAGSEGLSGGEAPAGGESGAGGEAASGPSGESTPQSVPEAAAGRPADAAIALGDLASASMRAPLVIPFSSAVGSAPSELADTAASAIAQQAGVKAGAPSLVDQIVHFAVPLTPGEEGPLNAAGIPAVLVQASGERGPAAHAALSAARMEGLGSAVLSTIDALDANPDIPTGPQDELVFSHDVVPGWTVRLLVAALLLPALAASLDGFARVRRRSEPVGRWICFTLACGYPFLLAALVLAVMGAVGLAGPVPGAPVSGALVPLGAGAIAATSLSLLALLLGWLSLPRVWRSLGLARGSFPAAAGAGLLVVLDAVALVTWLANPFAALLMVPAVHLWLVVAAPELRPRHRWASLGVVLLGVCAPALVVVYYAGQFAGGFTDSAWAAMLLIAGGRIGVGTLVLWSCALGSVAAATIVALAGRTAPRVREEPRPITVRGPLSYAGPGSLGGTESALRR